MGLLEPLKWKTENFKDKINVWVNEFVGLIILQTEHMYIMKVCNVYVSKKSLIIHLKDIR